MTIRIKLTNKEFEIVDAIRKGQKWDITDNEKKVATLTGETFPLIRLGGDGWELTRLGQLAFQQNQPKTKVEKPKDVVYTQCVEFWLKDFHTGWTFGAIQGKALKSLINKIRTSSTDSTDATLVATFKKLCQSLPEWYKMKDLPVLDSKFNEIISEIQRGPVKSFNSLNSAERFFSDYGK